MRTKLNNKYRHRAGQLLWELMVRLDYSTEDLEALKKKKADPCSQESIEALNKYYAIKFGLELVESILSDDRGIREKWDRFMKELGIGKDLSVLQPDLYKFINQVKMRTYGDKSLPNGKSTKVAEKNLQNCYNCEHLEWIDGEENDPSGFTCNKRLTGGESEEFEHKLLKQLESGAYLKRAKRCFEPKSKL